ncbi:MAG TPA: hypothetical protein VJV78_07765 [Polyangiales bacterium]|nr:hypothetical protein [Polyangiales bacterium]
MPNGMSFFGSQWRLAWVVIALNACAEGYDSTGVDRIAQPPPAGGSADFKGEACERGQSRPCMCPDGAEGMNLCTRDPLSPTLGSWLPMCLSCREPDPPPQPAAGDVAPDPETQTPAGAGGRGGRGGAAGRAAAGSGAAGRTSGGGGRSGGSSGGRCNCNQDCFPVGVLACCRPDGSCGCTWAPGAYCL